MTLEVDHNQTFIANSGKIVFVLSSSFLSRDMGIFMLEEGRATSWI